VIHFELVESCSISIVMCVTSNRVRYRMSVYKVVVVAVVVAMLEAALGLDNSLQAGEPCLCN